MHVIIDDGGIDWPAWVQAIGSIFAIALAIWIDQGADRRHRRERARDKEEARIGREDAIELCKVSLEVAARAVTNLSQTAVMGVGVESVDQVRGAANAVAYYLRSAEPTDVSLLSSLATTAEIMSRHMAIGDVRIAGEPSIRAWAIDLNLSAARIGAVQEAYWEGRRTSGPD
jgi:hypothetical protein